MQEEAEIGRGQDGKHDRVKDAERQHPGAGADPGDDGGQEVPQDITAQLRKDLASDQYAASSAGMLREPAAEPADGGTLPGK
jgi:hypothetical protein